MLWMTRLLSVTLVTCSFALPRWIIFHGSFVQISLTVSVSFIECFWPSGFQFHSWFLFSAVPRWLIWNGSFVRFSLTVLDSDIMQYVTLYLLVSFLYVFLVNEFESNTLNVSNLCDVYSTMSDVSAAAGHPFFHNHFTHFFHSQGYTLLFGSYLIWWWWTIIVFSTGRF